MGAPPPEQAPAPAVPADDRLGADQDEVAPPVRAEAPDQDPEEPVAAPELRPGRGAEGDRELVAQEQVLEDQIAAGTQAAAQGGEQEGEEPILGRA